MPGGYHHHGQFFINERVRPMFHLPGRVPFRMNVGNLLQLKSAFQGDGVMNPASEEEEVPAFEKHTRQLLNRVSAAQDRFQLGRQLRQLFGQAYGLLVGDLSPHLPHI